MDTIRVVVYKNGEVIDAYEGEAIPGIEIAREETCRFFFAALKKWQAGKTYFKKYTHETCD